MTSTVKRAVSRFVESIGCESTRIAYSGDLRKFQKFLGENTEISAITVEVVGTYIRQISGSPNFVQRQKATLKRFLSWIYRLKIADHDFSVEITLKRCRTPFKGRIIEREESAQVINHLYAKGDIRRAFLLEFLIKTGLRLSECASLTIGSIKNENLYIVGKGMVERKINLSHIRSSINRYLVFRGGNDDEALFLSQKGNRLSQSQIQNTVKMFFHTNCHSLRHSFSVALLSSGADLVSIKALLGHASLLTTQTYTDHIKDERLVEVLSKVA